MQQKIIYNNIGLILAEIAAHRNRSKNVNDKNTRAMAFPSQDTGQMIFMRSLFLYSCRVDTQQRRDDNIQHLSVSVLIQNVSVTSDKHSKGLILSNLTCIVNNRMVQTTVDK